MKKAIILFNLGGPDNLENVEPFLFNLFNDPAILNLPKFIRYPLAKLISKKRTPIAKKIYKEIGGSSPILKLTKDQANCLENSLNSKQNTTKYKAFVAMRCWHPRASETMQEVKKYNPNEIILLPLYPQYSAATSGSSLSEWKELANNNNLNIKTKTICCYPEDKNFIKAHSKLIMEKIKNLKNFKLIFSAHGLPEKNIKKGDPYQWQIEQSVKRIMDEINDSNIDYILSYQSRVGPLKWIGPSTDEVIVKNSKLNKCLVVVPIAFVSEHSETLVELDIEYEKLARTNSCAEYIRIETLGVNENFIDGLTDLILNNENYKLTDTLYPPKNRCPSNFTKCPCLN
jgi:ferrochelatase|tara:strand:+ start:821 stop:1849 length:1029 start_codon:yes stop_codon:yes gene_type:complete